MSQSVLRVVTAGPLPPTFPVHRFDGRAELCTAHTDDELRTMSQDADVLYSARIPETVPDETPRLRWVQLPSAGVDYVRNLPLWKSQVLVTSSTGVHAVPMSEHLFAMLLALIRQVPAFIRAQQTREWIHAGSTSSLHLQELHGKTLGIVGWGKIGESVANLARAFGMRVIGTRRSVAVRQGDVFPAAALHEVLAQSDVIVVLLPLTAETEGLVGEAEFRAMKEGSLFLNIGRGAVVDEEALVRVLRSGRLAGAGLDVFDQEPLPSSSPLWSMPNVVVSPHLGGLSDHTAERAAELFGVNLDRYLNGQSLFNVVDRQRGY